MCFHPWDNTERWQPRNVPISHHALQGKMWTEQLCLFYCRAVMMSPDSAGAFGHNIFSGFSIFKNVKAWAREGSLVGIKRGWPHFSDRRGGRKWRQCVPDTDLSQVTASVILGQRSARGQSLSSTAVCPGIFAVSEWKPKGLAVKPACNLQLPCCQFCQICSLFDNAWKLGLHKGKRKS